MMTETAGEYCLSKFEIQYGFHVSNSSSQHTKRISDKHGRSGNTPEDLSASNLPAFLSVIARLGHPILPTVAPIGPKLLSQKLAGLTHFWMQRTVKRSAEVIVPEVGGTSA